MMEWCLADGMSHSDISARTGTPLGTVKSVIRRGILRIREVLGTGRSTP
jgi:DNA-directed RNA polymerase specialized sigma24 family protein